MKRKRAGFSFIGRPRKRGIKSFRFGRDVVMRPPRLRRSAGVRALKMLKKLKKEEELKYKDITNGTSGNVASGGNYVGLLNGIA